MTGLRAGGHVTVDDLLGGTPAQRVGDPAMKVGGGVTVPGRSAVPGKGSLAAAEEARRRGAKMRINFLACIINLVITYHH